MADAPIYVTQADLEARYPPAHVARVFSDNGADRAGSRFATSASVGCRQADAILLKAWSRDELETLVLGDDGILDAVCDLVLAHGMKGKPEWSSGEGTIYANLKRDALASLQLFVTGQQRSRAEADAGANPNIRGRRTVPCPQFVFAPSRRNPKPGGY